MAAIGSVEVELSANIAKFTTALDKATQIAEDRMKQIDKSIGLVKAALGAIGVGFALGASFDAIKQKIEGAIESAAGLKDLAERTGTTVEAISGLSSVAKLSGTDSEQMAVGLQKLSKSMIDAQNGGEKTAAAFSAIGISAAEIRDKAPDQVFKLMADRLANYQDGAGKTVVMQMLLGKSGANLLPVMKDLADVGELQAKVTTEQAERADEYEKNLKRLHASTDAIFKKIGLDLIPVFNDFTKALLETQNANNGVRKSIDEMAQDGTLRAWAAAAANAAAFVIDAFEGVSRIVTITGNSLGAIAAQVTSVFRGDFAGAMQIAKDFRSQTDEILNVPLFSSRFAKQIADSKNQAALSAMRPGREDMRGQVNTRLLGNDNGPKDDPARKLLEGQLKAQEDFIASENKQLQRREQQLQYYAGLEYITEAEAVETKKQLIAENLKVTQAAYDKEIALLDQRIKTADKEVDRQDARNKRQEAVKKRAEAEIEANSRLVQSQEDLLAIQRQFDLQTKEADRQASKRDADAQFQIDLLGKSSLEVAKLCAQRQIQLDLEERIYQLRKKDPSADVSEAVALAETQKARAAQMIEQSYNRQRDASFGASEAIRKYGEEAANTGAQIEYALTNAFKSAEDAFVQFTMTGKLSFSDLARSIIADLVRIQARKMVAGAADGLGDVLGKLFGGGSVYGSAAADADAAAGLIPARASGGPVWSGQAFLVGEKGPELFTPPSSGTIIPNGALQGAGKPPVNFTNVINIDSRTDRNEVMALVNQSVRQGNAELVDRLQRNGRL